MNAKDWRSTLLYQVVPLKGKCCKLLMNLTFRQGGKGVVLYSYGCNLSNVNDIISAMLFLHVLPNKGNMDYLVFGNVLTSVANLSLFFFFPVGWIFHLQTLVLMFQLISHEVDHTQKSSKDSKECQILQFFGFVFVVFFFVVVIFILTKHKLCLLPNVF